MAIEEIITKLQGIEGLNLTEEEIKEIQGVTTQTAGDTDAAAALGAEKAAKARILEEKKKALLRAAELETQLEDLKTKDMSEVERLQAEIEKVKASNQTAEEAKLALQKEYDTTVRLYHLEKVGGSIRFLDTIPKDLQRIAVEKAFNEVDLTDEEAVKVARDTFSTEYSSILAATDAATGTGSTTGTGKLSGTKTPDQMTVDERAKYLADKKLS